MCRRRNCSDGTSKSQPGQRIDPPPKCPQSLQILRIHWLLPLLHPGILADCQTALRPHKAGNVLALGWKGARSIQELKGQDGQQTSPPTTKLQQNVLPPNGCVKVQSRSSPILRWGNERGDAKEATPNHVLFHHILPYWTELQHSQPRIPWSHQVNWTLEALPYLDQRTLHNWNGPQEPHILEGPQEANRANSMLVTAARWKSTKSYSHVFWSQAMSCVILDHGVLGHVGCGSQGTYHVQQPSRDLKGIYV